jgi:hypothetical protein
MEDRNKHDGWDAYLIEQIQRLKEAPPRNAKAHASGKDNFLREARTIKSSLDLPLPVSNGPFTRLNNWKLQVIEVVRRKERIPMFVTVMSFLVAFILVFGGAGATAITAQDSSPNELLYPVKLMTEEVQLSLARDAKSQIDLLLQLNDRRSSEIAGLVESNLPVTDKLIQRLKVQINDALKLAADLDDEEEGTEEALVKIRENLRKQDSIMSRTRANAPEEIDPLLAQWQHTLRNQLRLVDEGLEDPLTYQQRFRFRSNQELDDPELEEILDEILSQGKGENDIEETPGDTPVKAGEEYGPGSETGAGPQAGPGPNAGPEAEAEPNFGPGQNNGPGPDAGAGPGPNEDSGGSDSGNQKEGSKEDEPTSGSSKNRP